MENGPGPQVRASSPDGGRYFSTISLGRPSQGLSSMARHTIMVIVPPGLRARRMFLRPTTGFSKNIAPKREKQKSYSGSKG